MTNNVFCMSSMLAALAILIRWLSAKDAITPFDTFFYLLSAREVHRQKVGISGTLNLPLLPRQRISVPYLLQWIVGFLPEKWMRMNHAIIGVVIDGLFSALLFAITLRANFSIETALLVYVLYLLTPAMFSRVAIGPRVSSFTPRLLSEIVGNLFLITMFVPLGLSEPWRFCLASVLAAGLLLISKFGLQVLLFVVPISSLIALNIAPVFAVLVGFVLAILLTKGRCLDSFVAQIKHLAAYAVKNLRREMPISNRNSLVLLRQYLNSKKAIESPVGKALYYFLSLNSFTSVLLKFTCVPLVLAIIGWQFWFGDTIIPVWLLSPILGSTIVFFAINIPVLLFLGEAERYISHSSYFFLLAAVQLSQSAPYNFLATALIVIGGLYWLAEIFLLPKIERGERQKYDAGTQILAILRQDGLHKKVALFPYHAIGVWRVAYENGYDVVYPISLEQSELEQFKPFAGTYPYIDLNRFEEMSTFYGISVLVIKKGSPVPEGFALSIDWKEIASENGVFSVYERC